MHSVSFPSISIAQNTLVHAAQDTFERISRCLVHVWELLKNFFADLCSQRSPAQSKILSHQHEAALMEAGLLDHQERMKPVLAEVQQARAKRTMKKVFQPLVEEAAHKQEQRAELHSRHVAWAPVIEEIHERRGLEKKVDISWIFDCEDALQAQFKVNEMRNLARQVQDGVYPKEKLPALFEKCVAEELREAVYTEIGGAKAWYEYLPQLLLNRLQNEMEAAEYDAMIVARGKKWAQNNPSLLIPAICSGLEKAIAGNEEKSALNPENNGIAGSWHYSSPMISPL